MFSQLSSCNTLNYTVNYYPGGMLMPGRGTGLGDYRYAYNGKKQDDEIKGYGNSYDYGERMHDPRLGRFMSLDPFLRLSADRSPYSYAGNSPILFTDINGLFQFPAGQEAFYKKNYPRLYNYVKNYIEDIADNPTIVKTLAKYSSLSEDQVREALKYGQGPTIQVKFIPISSFWDITANSRPLGVYDYWGQRRLTIDSEYQQMIEDASPEDKEATRLLMGVTILHEFMHWGDDENGDNYPGEEGNDWEKETYGRRVIDIDKANKVLQEYNQRHTEPNMTELDEITIYARPNTQINSLPLIPLQTIKITKTTSVGTKAGGTPKFI